MLQQSQERSRRRGGRITPTAHRVRSAALAGSLALLPLAAGCGAGEDDAEAKSNASRAAVTAAPAAGVAAPAKVEVIADLTGCKPKIRIEADELRQGLCHTKELDYLITTFPEERYKQTWLDSAAIYGGKYLVGPRWIVSAKDPELLEKFRAQLGGQIQQLHGIGPTVPPSAS